MKNSYALLKLTLLAVIVSASFFNSSFAQEKRNDITKKVSKAVLESFKKDYPDAVIKKSGTEKDKGTTYIEIESIDGKTKRDLLYLPDGKVVEIEEMMSEGDLPAAIKESANKEIPDGKIKTAEKVTREGVVSYELIIKNGKKSTELVFDKDGKITKKEKLK